MIKKQKIINLKLILTLVGLIPFFMCGGFAQERAKTYDAMLKQYISQVEIKGYKLSGVDYQAWNNDQRHKVAMAEITQTDFTKLNERELMAYWINAYNLLTIDLIIKNNEKESIKNLGSLFSSPWKKHSWKIQGKEYTLDEIEHEILRPMGDPRIHMAIVCASLSCPDLLNEAYNGEKLDEQLRSSTLEFLENEGKGLKKAGNDLVISKIFSWFEKDFGGEGGVLKFIEQHTGIKGVIDDYFDYDWSLNDIARVEEK